MAQRHPLPSFSWPVVRRCRVQRICQTCRSESCDHRRIRTHCQSGKTKRGADSGYRIRPTPGLSSNPPWAAFNCPKGN